MSVSSTYDYGTLLKKCNISVVNTYHFLERERFIANNEAISAAEIPEDGINYDQL